MVTAISMIGEIFSVRERAKYQGFIGGVFAVASILGPIIGGYITETFSWRWTFYINIPLGVLAFLLIYMYVPRRLSQAKQSVIDYLGSLLLVAFLVPLVLMFSSMSTNNTVTTQTVLLLVSSIVAFMFFYRVEKRAPSPIFSHRLFFDRYFVIPAIMTFMNAIIFFAATLYLQMYTQKVIGISIQGSGLLLASIMIPLTLSSLVYGNIIARTGKYKKVVIFGATLLMLATVHFTYLLHGVPSEKAIAISLIPLGLGLGAMMSVFTMVITMIYPRERLGEVTGALQLVRGVGGTFGTAFLGVIFGYFVKDINGDASHVGEAVIAIFTILSGVTFLSCIAALFMKEKQI